MNHDSYNQAATYGQSSTHGAPGAWCDFNDADAQQGEFNLIPKGTVGDAYDNAMAESFFATLECELIDRRSWKTKAEARLAIFTWIESWYNPLRRHSGLGQRSPNAFERSINSQKPDIDIIEANDQVREGQSVR
jgi:hypothetical protein